MFVSVLLDKIEVNVHKAVIDRARHIGNVKVMNGKKSEKCKMKMMPGRFWPEKV